MLLVLRCAVVENNVGYTVTQRRKCVLHHRGESKHSQDIPLVSSSVLILVFLTLDTLSTACLIFMYVSRGHVVVKITLNIRMDSAL